MFWVFLACGVVLNFFVIFVLVAVVRCACGFVGDSLHYFFPPVLVPAGSLLDRHVDISIPIHTVNAGKRNLDDEKSFLSVNDHGADVSEEPLADSSLRLTSSVVAESVVPPSSPPSADSVDSAESSQQPQEVSLIGTSQYLCRISLLLPSASAEFREETVFSSEEVVSHLRVDGVRWNPKLGQVLDEEPAIPTESAADSIDAPMSPAVAVSSAIVVSSTFEYEANDGSLPPLDSSVSVLPGGPATDCRFPLLGDSGAEAPAAFGVSSEDVSVGDSQPFAEDTASMATDSVWSRSTVSGYGGWGAPVTDLSLSVGVVRGSSEGWRVGGLERNAGTDEPQALMSVVAGEDEDWGDAFSMTPKDEPEPSLPFSCSGTKASSEEPLHSSDLLPIPSFDSHLPPPDAIVHLSQRVEGLSNASNVLNESRLEKIDRQTDRLSSLVRDLADGLRQRQQQGGLLVEGGSESSSSTGNEATDTSSAKGDKGGPTENAPSEEVQKIASVEDESDSDYPGATSVDGVTVARFASRLEGFSRGVDETRLNQIDRRTAAVQSLVEELEGTLRQVIQESS